MSADAPKGKGLVLTGRASSAGTARYAKRIATRYPDYNPELALTWLPQNNWAVSRMAFGTYRVATGFDQHFDAMREALLCGTNVIDTSHVYTDGAAEILVGRVLAQMIEAGRLKRDEVVIITKAGLVQGGTLRSVRRKELGLREAEEINEQMLHCLHPHFLRHQMEDSLRRMQLESLDFVLLDGPQRQLLAARSRGESRATAMARLEKRLEQAFSYLEKCCDEGIIQAYGVSSAGFFGEDYSCIPLRPYLRLAGPRFQLVQFEANLLEDRFRTEPQMVLTPARSKNLWCMSVRPLNAEGPAGLLRLARLATPPPDDGAATIAEMNRLLDAVQQTEAEIQNELRERHFRFDSRTPAASDVVRINRDRFVNLSHLDRALPTIRQLVQRSVNRLAGLASGGRPAYLLEQYVRRVNALLACWRKYAALIHHQNMADLEEELAAAAPSLRNLPLAVQAVLSLLAENGADTVAVGMRRRAYVRMLQQVYSAAPPGHEEVPRLFRSAQSCAAKNAKDDSPKTGAVV